MQVSRSICSLDGRRLLAPAETSSILVWTSKPSSFAYLFERVRTMGKKSSILWSISKEKMQSIIDECSSLGEVIERFGLVRNGNYQTLYKKIEHDNIDISELRKRTLLAASIRASQTVNKVQTEQMLVSGSTTSTQVIKRRVLKDGLLKYQCEKCLNDGTWLDQSISLQLDHRNGDSSDHRLENLRFLCPNCHSQTETFCGRNAKKNTSIKTYNDCVVCKKKTPTTHSMYCDDCRWLINEKSRKVKSRPDSVLLNKDVKTLGFLGTGRKYGVSDNTIRKWLKWSNNT